MTELQDWIDSEEKWARRGAILGNIVGLVAGLVLGVSSTAGDLFRLLVCALFGHAWCEYHVRWFHKEPMVTESIVCDRCGLQKDP